MLPYDLRVVSYQPIQTQNLALSTSTSIPKVARTQKLTQRLKFCRIRKTQQFQIILRHNYGIKILKIL